MENLHRNFIENLRTKAQKKIDSEFFVCLSNNMIALNAANEGKKTIQTSLIKFGTFTRP